MRDFYLGSGGTAAFDGARADAAAQAYKANALELSNAESAARDMEIVKQAAKNAVDPKTGQYSLDRHTQLLEQAGFPELAAKTRTESVNNLRSAYQTLDAALPKMNEQTYATMRQELVSKGMPAALIPEQYDAEWVRRQHQTLGMAVQQYGPMEQVASGPGGTVLYGQTNRDTGELSNVRDMSPPRPYASRTGGGGRGGFAPSNTEKKAAYYAQQYGIPEPIALDIVRNEEEGGGPYQLYGKVLNTMLSQFASEEEAAAAAKELVEGLYGDGAIDMAARPGRPLAGDARRRQTQGSPSPQAGAQPGQGKLVPSAAPNPASLKPDVVNVLRNGSGWILQNGKAVQVY